MQENEMTAVTPADREQALALRTMIEGARSGGEQALYRSGAYDHTHEVQAFARHRQQAEDAMRLRVELLQQVLSECAEELAAEVAHRYAGIGDHPAMAHKLERDMQAVFAARSAIRAATLSKEGE